MEHLPNELVEQILLKVPLRDLREACSVSQRVKSLCSSRAFWVNKFRSSQLPPPQDGGKSIPEWIKYYHRALIARDMTESFYNPEYKFIEREIVISRVEDPIYLVAPGMDLNLVEKYLSIEKEAQDIDSEMERLSMYDDISPEEQKELDELVRNRIEVKGELFMEKGVVTYTLRAYSLRMNLEDSVSYPVKELPKLFIYNLYLHNLIY